MYKQIEVLYSIFIKLNKQKFENKLPIPIITIQSHKVQKQIKGSAIMGWCSVHPIWQQENNTQYEINLTAEFVNRNIYEIVETLLHEMVHLYNASRGVADCSKKQFHNENFKDVAESVGLIVNKVKQHGYSDTRLSEELIKEVNSWDDINKGIFNIARIDAQQEKTGSERKKKIKMMCPVCKRTVFTEYEDLEINCMECGCEFKKQ
jgi:hypothetical protein